MRLSFHAHLFLGYITASLQGTMFMIKNKYKLSI